MQQISNLARLSNAEKLLTNEISSAKSEYESKLIRDFAFKNQSKIYKYIRNIKKSVSIPNTVHFGEASATEDISKATLFNKFFYSVFSTNNTTSNTSNTNIDTSIRQHLVSINISEEDVLEALNSLDPDKSSGIDTIGPRVLKKCANFLCGPLHHLFSTSLNKQACGPDLLPARLLKMTAEFIAPSLAQIFQLSLSSGKLPLDWTSANIVPIHKKGDKQLTANYCPISLTSIVVKIMERIIHRHLVCALEEHNLLSDCQFGFCHKRSTVSLLLQAVHDWAGSLDRRNSTHCLFLDLAKAFDSVSHPRLLLKLEALGITDNILSWLKEFLTVRRQRVVVNGQFSSWLPVTSGVPQGSVLGPLLFILFINDISLVVSNSTVKLFADVDLLQCDLSKVVAWAKTWMLRLNPDKCESIVLSNRRVPPVPHYYLNSKLISCKPVARYLGIFVDCHLNWNSHCQHVAAKATRSLNFLRHCLFNCSSKVKSASYKCIVRPVMEYACPVWFLHTAKNINHLERVQHRAARWASGSRWNPSSYCWTKSTDDCLAEL